ncbi:MAG: helix-turn-helix transcriptional regulator [Paludibacteraceae bacterium]|nr:helix-turn-helix transcriptional regulator [Paludibacteraceae bacterium]MBR6105182.1 helix-turn-helix transcriptional regulator [Paludibacteraceae bacterium]
MAVDNIIQIDSVDTYNKMYGWETLHPLVTVVNHKLPLERLNHSRLNYSLYALFLKQGEGCSIRYGREKYDYQAGTMVCFKPGQVVAVEWDDSRPMPASRGLLFHPDLIYGTPLSKRIHDYTFFDYDQREALHLSEREQRIVSDLLDSIEEELRHPVDKHTQTLVTDAIGLLLDYCMRYYDRQFITRHKQNSDIIGRFQHELEDYLRSGEAELKGLPTVAYFAEKAFLSPGYFGDLIKKETGLTAQRYIQNKIIDLSKQYVMDPNLTINQVAYKLGFQYPQHFTRLFKQQVGVTPSEYRQ